MDKESKQLVMSNLHFKYNVCVDPQSVVFGVHPTNDLGFCKTDTSLSSVVKASWTQKAAADGKQIADLTLKIDANNLNADKLGDAYRQSNGERQIVFCVHARVVEDGVEILSTKTKVRFSLSAQFSISAVNVDRHDNDKVAETIGVISRSNRAYQCDEQYKEITSPAPLSRSSNALRVCVEGESEAFQCENIVSATLKQAGNTDTKLITDGTLSAKYTEQSSKGQICRLTTLVPPKYFVKKSADDKVHTYMHIYLIYTDAQTHTYAHNMRSQLSLTLEGSVLMPRASRRGLVAGDKNFELTVKLLPAEDTQISMVSQGTFSSVCKVVISAVIAISMLM